MISLPPLLAVAAPVAQTMTLSLGGWIIMVLSVGFVTGLLTWSLVKVLTTPQSTEHLHAQPDIDTHDH